MKVLVLTYKEHRSPRVLAESLVLKLKKEGVDVNISYNLDNFKTHHRNRVVNKFWQKIAVYFQILNVFYFRIIGYKTILICDCIPNAFIKTDFNLHLLKKNEKFKLGLYEVYNILDTPSMYSRFKDAEHYDLSFYDFYLSGSRRNEGAMRLQSKSACFMVGLFLSEFRNLKSVQSIKRDFAIVDFCQKGYEKQRDLQIDFLRNNDIPFIELNGEYTHDTLRDLYLQAKYYFLHSHESFGLPIAECLFNGTIVFTPSWEYPTAWIYNNGLLENFIIYNDTADLKKKFEFVRENFDSISKKVMDISETYFYDYYHGNSLELRKFISYISVHE